MSFMDDLPSEAPTVIVEAPKKTQLAELEDEVFRESEQIMRDCLAFAQLDPEKADECPQEWILELGEKEALRRWNTARMALMSPKEAPVGLQIATRLYVGITAARSTEKSLSKAIGVAFVEITRPLPQYPVKELEE
jgi:hypothetical protein